MTKKSVSEQITEQLRKDIILKKYKLNERLVEYVISREMKVSVTPVRHAFTQLEKEGLVVISPYKGACVTNIDERIIEDIQVTRKMIERKAVKTAYSNLIKDDPKCLMNIIKKAEEINPMDKYGLLLNDMKFHECIIQHSENKILLEFWYTVFSRVMLLQSYAKQDEEFSIKRFQQRHIDMANAVMKQLGEDVFLEIHEKNMVEAFSGSELKIIYANIL